MTRETKQFINFAKRLDDELEIKLRLIEVYDEYESKGENLPDDIIEEKLANDAAISELVKRIKEVTPV